MVVAPVPTSNMLLSTMRVTLFNVVEPATVNVLSNVVVPLTSNGPSVTRLVNVVFPATIMVEFMETLPATYKFPLFKDTSPELINNFPSIIVTSLLR